MNLEQVAHHIAAPNGLGLAEAPALKALSEKYPYAAVFSLLYLTALANGKSVDLDDALQLHAYKLSDRTKLYHLLHGSDETEPSSSLEGGLRRVAEPSDENVSAANFIPLNPPSKGETEPSSSLEGGLRRVTAPSEENVSAENLIPLDPPSKGETEPSSSLEGGLRRVTEPSDENVSAENLIHLDPPSKGETETGQDFGRITEAFTREQHFEHPEPEDAPVAQQSLEAAEQAFSVAEEETRTAETIAANTEPPASEPQKETTEQSPSGDEARRSFTSWLRSGAHATEAPETVQPETVPSAQGSEPAADNTSEKRSVDDIIEHFIREEPKITRAKTEFFSPSRKAKESLDEEAVPVSETLAKIFAAQGNYPKAIHVYHQLMLSFPEKKSFFAIQIEALKKKITP